MTGSSPHGEGMDSEEMEMHTSNTSKAKLGCFVTVSAIAWLGCTSDVTESEGVGSTSEAILASSPGVSQVGTTPPPPPCPNGPTTTVWALPHDPGDPGYLDEYTTNFPAHTSEIPATDTAVRAYEREIWTYVTHSNGFEYAVSQINPSQGRYTLYFGVGINGKDTPRASIPPVYNTGAPPTTTDWDNEYSIAAKGNSTPAVAAIFPPLTCVRVVAYGGTRGGTTIGFYPVMDLHDPKGPAW
jgi:hypothetical protein